jgi:hypothetical protein
MTISLVKETHAENRKTRYSIERDGQFIDGTLTTDAESARRMYETVKRTASSSVWQREVIDTAEICNK